MKLKNEKKDVLKKQVSAWGKVLLGSEEEEGLMSMRVCVRVNSWSSAGSLSCAQANLKNLLKSCCPNSCSVCHRYPMWGASGDTPTAITLINVIKVQKWDETYHCIPCAYVKDQRQHTDGHTRATLNPAMSSNPASSRAPLRQVPFVGQVFVYHSRAV